MERHVAYRQDLLYRDVCAGLRSGAPSQRSHGLGLLDLEDEEAAQTIGDAEAAVQSGTCRHEVVPMQLVQPGRSARLSAYLRGTGVRERSIRALGARPERTLVLDDGAGVSCDMRALSQSRGCERSISDRQVPSRLRESAPGRRDQAQGRQGPHQLDLIWRKAGDLPHEAAQQLVAPSFLEQCLQPVDDMRR
jgi:hypothetical protein